MMLISSLLSYFKEGLIAAWSGNQDAPHSVWDSSAEFICSPVNVHTRTWKQCLSLQELKALFT